MISGGGGSSSSSTKPWEGQQQYLRDLYSRAEGLFGGSPYQYAGGQTVAGFDPASQRAFHNVEQRATMGSPLNQAAQGHAQSTIEGQYLDPDSNPWLARTGETAARGMTRNYYGAVNALGSQMEASGRTGSGAHATGANVNDENFATGLGDMYANLYGGAYDQERGRMMGATQMAPALAETDYRDQTALRNVGQQREQQSQRTLDDLLARFNFQQYEPSQRLAEFAGFLGNPVMQSNSKSFNMNLGIGG